MSVKLRHFYLQQSVLTQTKLSNSDNDILFPYSICPVSITLMTFFEKVEYIMDSILFIH